MSRIKALTGRPRQTLSALALVLVAVAVAVGSGANFTARSSVANNTFASGTLTVSTVGTTALNITNLKPGDVRTGTADVQNTGTVTANFTLDESAIVDPDTLLGELDLKVQDCGVYVGATPPTCGAGSTVVFATAKTNTLANVPLGNWAGGEKHRFLFTTTMPGTTGNAFQGKSATATFDWSAVSG